MTLKSVSVFLAISLLAAACGQNVRRGSTECLSALETSSKASTVSTQSGPVCGYIDNGVFIYKGIPYGQAERFMPPTDPEPWRKCVPAVPTVR